MARPSDTIGRRRDVLYAHGARILSAGQPLECRVRLLLHAWSTRREPRNGQKNKTSDADANKFIISLFIDPFGCWVTITPKSFSSSSSSRSCCCPWETQCSWYYAVIRIVQLTGCLSPTIINLWRWTRRFFFFSSLRQDDSADEKTCGTPWAQESSTEGPYKSNGVQDDPLANIISCNITTKFALEKERSPAIRPLWLMMGICCSFE